MKKINTYITEKLKLNKDSCEKYNYYPKNKNELIEIVTELIKKRGKNADLNDIDVSEITDMSELFYKININKININNIDISEWDVSNVHTAYNMFYGCTNFNCDLSNWDVSNLVTAPRMFYGCESFNSDLSKWNVSKLRSAQGMFSDCFELDCDFENWNLDKHTVNIGQMFFHCHALRNNKKIPEWYPYVF